MPKIVLLWTDVVLYAMLLALAWYGWRIRVNDNLRANWWKVLRDPAAFSAAIVLAMFALVTVADSVHFRRALAPAGAAAVGAGSAQRRCVPGVLLRRARSGLCVAGHDELRPLVEPPHEHRRLPGPGGLP